MYVYVAVPATQLQTLQQATPQVEGQFARNRASEPTTAPTTDHAVQSVRRIEEVRLGRKSLKSERYGSLSEAIRHRPRGTLTAEEGA